MKSGQHKRSVCGDPSKCCRIQKRNAQGEVDIGQTWQSIDERKSIKVKKDHLLFKDEDYSQLNAEYKAKAKKYRFR